MTYTIQDAYAAQDASDMFFNNELVTAAYSKMHEAATDEDESLNEYEARDLFIKLLSEHFGKFAEAIADDFLGRV
jgi:hypothetical protein